MDVTTEPEPIAVATYGDLHLPTQARGVFNAIASIRISDAAAADLIASIPDLSREVATMIDGGWEMDRHSSLIAPVMAKLGDGRYLVGLRDRKPVIASHVAALLFNGVWVPADQAFHRNALRERVASAIEDFLASGDFHSAVGRLDQYLAGRDLAPLAAMLPGVPELRSFLARNAGHIADFVGRYRSDTLMSVVDVEGAVCLLHAHRDAWGRWGKAIHTTCSDEVPRAPVPPLLTAGPLAYPRAKYGLRGSADEGAWCAWRADGPVGFASVAQSPSLQLARLIGAATAALAASGRVGDEPWARDIECNYWGDYELFASDRFSSEHRAFELAEEEDRIRGAPDHIRGGDLLAARDRLIDGMLENGIDVELMLSLRIVELEIEQPYRDFHLTAWKGSDDGRSEPVKVMTMDSKQACDFFTLVRASGDLVGFLFSCGEAGASYGNRALTRSELDSAVTKRRRVMQVGRD